MESWSLATSQNIGGVSMGTLLRGISLKRGGKSQKENCQEPTGGSRQNGQRGCLKEKRR